MVPFGPLLAAVIAAGLTGGLRGPGRLFAQLGRWPSSPRWYLIALVVPVLITGLAAGVTVALGRPPADLPSRPDAGAVIATFVSTVVLVGLFEEVGWRGYALPAPATGGGRPTRRPTARGDLGLVAPARTRVRSRPAAARRAVRDPRGRAVGGLELAVQQHPRQPALVIISHATIDTVARFVLPQFTGSDYQLIWWCQAALWTGLALLVAAATQSTLNAAQPHRTRVGSEATSARVARQTRPSAAAGRLHAHPVERRRQ